MTDGFRGALRGSVISFSADRLGNPIPQGNRIAFFAYFTQGAFYEFCLQGADSPTGTPHRHR